MNKKVLFFDIDGTLVDHIHHIKRIPEGVLKEMKRLQSMGHKMFICTGRPKAMIDDYFLEAGFDGYILANGGYVELEGQSLYEDRMDYELAMKTADMLETLNCDYMIETANHVYIDKDFHELYDFFVNAGHGDMFVRDFDRDDVLKRTIKMEANVLNKDKEKVISYIENHFGYVINYDQHGTDNAFELYSPTISKAVGIQKVLEHFHLTKEDSYGFGDGVNDMEMIEYCGIGVAMGNAIQELKDIADVVCDSIENNGLEKILKELFPE